MTGSDGRRFFHHEGRAPRSHEVARVVASVVADYLIVEKTLAPEAALQLSARVAEQLLRALDSTDPRSSLLPVEEDPEVRAGAPAAPLSQREQELLTLVAEGLTDSQIAERLFISVHTVGSHLDRIRAKTGCRRRADLTRLALRLPSGPPAA
ncbi:MAG TPA: helix-turn-helix transcriptional regulator [Acidimicrobiales bacterium]|nr:helix-turn-helix transcriptional regulator [Acidimicrobiales bacterium]